MAYTGRKDEVVTAYDSADPAYNQPIRQKSYTPTATKPWTLVAFLTAILACIALLEVVSHTKLDIKLAPHIIPPSQRQNNTKKLSERGHENSFEYLVLRQDIKTTSSRLARRQGLMTTTPIYLSLRQDVTTTTTSPPGTTAAPSGDPVVDKEPGVTTTAAPDGDNVINDETDTTTTTTTTTTTAASAPDGDHPTTDEPTTTPTPTTTTTTTTSRPPGQTAAPDGDHPTTDEPTTTTTTTSRPGVGSQFTTLTPTRSQSLTVAITYAPTPGATALTINLPNGTPTTIPIPTMNDGDQTTSLLLTLTYPSSPTATSSDSVKGDELVSSATYHSVDYFLALYLPTLLAVILSSFWATVFAGMKMMEPFYRLSRPEGSSAKDSFFAEYLSPGLDISTVRAMFSGHLITLLSSITYLLMSLVVSLSGESMTVRATAYCKTSLSDSQPCAPRWFVDHSVVRVLEALLSCVFIIVFAIIILSLKRSSGVSSDPSSIASMASLLGHPAVLDDLRSIHPLARSKDARHALQYQRYRLGHYYDPAGRTRYGVVKDSPHSVPQEVSTPQGWAPVPDRDGFENRRQSQILFILRDVGFIFLILGLFGVIVAYYNTKGFTRFDKFFNSQTFGPRFLLSVCAVLINIGWKQLDQETRIMEPWRQMAQRPTRGDRCVVTAVASTSYSSIFIALFHRRPFVIFISGMAILGEALVIVVNGIPYTTSQMRLAFNACSYVSMAILILMAGAAAAVTLRRRGNPSIPRNPNTLANVWLYLCDGRLLDEQREMDTFQDRQALADTHKQTFYNLAYSTGVDGQMRWMIT